MIDINGTRWTINPKTIQLQPERMHYDEVTVLLSTINDFWRDPIAQLLYALTPNYLRPDYRPPSRTPGYVPPPSRRSEYRSPSRVSAQRSRGAFHRKNR